MKINFKGILFGFKPLFLLMVLFLLSSTVKVNAQGSLTQTVICKCDINKNGTVDITDFSIFKTDFGTNNPRSDFLVNDDPSKTVVDISDFTIFVGNFGKACPTNTATPTPTPTEGPQSTSPTPNPTPGAASTGIWISPAQLKSYTTTSAMTSAHWTAVYNDAKASWGTPNVADQDSNHDVYTLAGAIVCVTKGEFCDKTDQALAAAVGTEGNTRWLAVGRNLMSYTIAADLMGMGAGGNSTSPNRTKIYNWLAGFLTKELPDNNTGVLEKLPPFESGSNASAQEGAVYVALAAFTKDKAKLDYVWNRFRLYSCDKTNNPETVIDLARGVEYGWAHNDSSPCAVNPLTPHTKKDPNGVKVDGQDPRINGAIINDMRRGGSYKFPPGYTSYPWVGLEGYVPAALMLYRQGYPAFEIADKAVARTYEYLWWLKTKTGNSDWFDGSRADETTQIVNQYYRDISGYTFTLYPVQSGIGLGRTFGYTGFTHPSKDSLKK